ncbi:ACT domain-containing protein [Flavobacteriaceae bacterium AU392]|nr:ACT domain-containing protein [Flavobacteriaceae bacterium]RKM82736.1 ACT domain-containing protein [Flavobacteriaceae bacterium AU392]
MKRELNLKMMIKSMKPKLNRGTYIFTTLKTIDHIDRSDIICEFKEEEGITLIIQKEKADELNLKYEFVASWITLTVHSSLNAIGLTAEFSRELTKHQISCNVIAGYYHDHIFVNVKDKNKAIEVLENLSKNYK